MGVTLDNSKSTLNIATQQLKQWAKHIQIQAGHEKFLSQRLKQTDSKTITHK